MIVGVPVRSNRITAWTNSLALSKQRFNLRLIYWEETGTGTFPQAVGVKAVKWSLRCHTVVMVVPVDALNLFFGGRHVTGVGFESMVPVGKFDRLTTRHQAVATRCPHYVPGWTFLFDVLVASGSRLREAWRLSGDEKADVRVIYGGGDVALFAFTARGQKSKRDEIVPSTPDMTRLLACVSHKKKAYRVGNRCNPLPKRGESRHQTHTRAIRILSNAGRIADLRVRDRFASGHYLRRRDTIGDPENEILISPASYWKMAIKISLKKWQLNRPYQEFMDVALVLYAFSILPILPIHTEALLDMPFYHRDPFYLLCDR